MAKYRKKPVEIEAVRWDGTNVDELCGFALGAASLRRNLGDQRRLVIETLEGIMTAMPGDWIIRGIKGEFYPCKPDIFAASYEPADSA
jgi:hypothetical protein